MNVTWSKLSIKHKAAFFIVGLLGFSWLFYSYILALQDAKIAELRDKQQTIEQSVAIVQNFAKQHPNTELYLAETGKKAAAADAMLPNQPEFGSFLMQLQQATVDAGLLLTEIKLTQVANKAGYREFPVEVVVQGSFSQTLDFLQKMENIPRFNTVNAINVSSHQGMLVSKIAISAYSYGVPQTAQNKAQGQPTAQK